MKRRILPALLCAALALSAGCGGKPSVRQLRNKADTGDVNAQYELGLRHARGDKIAADPATANGWFRKAAANGHAEAQLAFARALLTGNGTVKDRATALGWLRQASERGLRAAQLELGLTLLNGDDSGSDPAGAVAWLTVAQATSAELSGKSLTTITAGLSAGQKAAADTILQEAARRSRGATAK